MLKTLTNMKMKTENIIIIIIKSNWKCWCQGKSDVKTITETLQARVIIILVII